jgi:hypothetical protein
MVEAGNTYGSWSVVQRDTAARGKWMCMCKCGATYSVDARNLEAGLSTQCRKCADTKGPSIDLVGKKFGTLNVMQYAGYIGNKFHAKWRCVCDCGAESFVAGSNLRSGAVAACMDCGKKSGAKKAEATKTANGAYAKQAAETITRKKAMVGDNYTPQSDPWRHCALRIKNSARRRGLEFGFVDHFEMAAELRHIAPERCPVTGNLLLHGSTDQASCISIDRVDNALGYVPGNVQVISRMANRMKADASRATLLAFANWILTTNNTMDSK